MFFVEKPYEKTPKKKAMGFRPSKTTISTKAQLNAPRLPGAFELGYTAQIDQWIEACQPGAAGWFVRNAELGEVVGWETSHESRCELGALRECEFHLCWNCVDSHLEVVLKWFFEDLKITPRSLEALGISI